MYLGIVGSRHHRIGRVLVVVALAVVRMASSVMIVALGFVGVEKSFVAPFSLLPLPIVTIRRFCVE